MLFEVAIESVADALAAERAGAGRLELCANLRDGGTTPSAGMLRAVMARVHLPMHAIIRPRAGDFLYAAEEVEVMLRDIEAAKGCGVQGIVGGALHANGTIDEDGTEALLEAAAPLPFTFHRAFDLTRDLDESLDTLMALGAARVLTSGGRATALEGRDVIRRLVQRARSHLVVMAGGGVRADHVVQLVAHSGVTEVHLGPRRPVADAMRFDNPGVRVEKGREAGSTATELDDAEVAAAVRSVRPA